MNPKERITYKLPPIIEVAISVQFEIPHGLNLAHIGAFWFSLKDQYETVKIAPAINIPTENYAGKSWLPPSIELSFTDEPDCRLQMASHNGEWLCQIQKDRFVINWRKRDGDYPRYDETLRRFLMGWNQWNSFVVGLKFEPLNVLSWEIAYVNRVPRGPLWTTPSDWPKIFPGLWGGEFVSPDDGVLKGIHGQWVWESVEQKARLYVEPKPAQSSGKIQEDYLHLYLTARGLVDSESGNDLQKMLEAGINYGHDWIVSTFDRIASDTAKQHWERNNAN